MEDLVESRLFLRTALLALAGLGVAMGQDACVDFARWAESYKPGDLMSPEARELAAQRYARLIELMRTDQRQASACLLPESRREALRGLTPDVLEQDVETTGTVADLYEDWPDEEGRLVRGVYRERLAVGGREYELHRLRAGTGFAGVVRIRGIAAGDHLLVLDEHPVAQTKQGRERLLRYSDGPKTVLFLRVDFSDRAGEPVSAGDAQARMGEVNNYFQLTSYGKTSLTTTVTPLIRMPQPASYYVSQGNFTLRTDAFAAAEGAGFPPDSYSFVVLAYARIYTNSSPSGSKYYRTVWTNGSFHYLLLAHELGHSYGVGHANLWRSADGTLETGTAVTYGDRFDLMGGGGDSYAVFNPKFRHQLGWLPEGDAPFVTTSGTQRLYTSQSLSGKRALRIRKDAQRTYWIEYAGAYGTNLWTPAGILLRVAYANSSSDGGGNDVMLLDGHPDGTQYESEDAPILIGQTYTDREAGIHITPRSVGGIGTAAYIDVAIDFANYSANRAPALSISGPSAVAWGQAGAFSATGSDADGDVLQYRWTFRTASRLPEYALGPSVSKAPAVLGTYVVTCQVWDGKGGTAMASKLVTFGGLQTTTRVISGTVMKSGSALAGALLLAPETIGACTTCLQASRSDANGAFYMVMQTGTGGALNATLSGHTFSPASVAVPGSGDLTGLVFTASARQNQGPAVTLGTAYPINTAVTTVTYGLGQPIPLYADAADTDGSVVRVEFYSGARLIGIDSVSSTPSSGTFIHQWFGADAGVHDVKAVAVDDTGARAESNSLRITIVRPQNTVSIRGRVVTPQPFGSILVSVNGGGINYRVNINLDGSYFYNVPVGGNYQLTASGEGESFSPPSYTFTNLRADVTADFEVVTDRAATAAPTAQTTGAVRFVPVVPCRVADTRNANGAFGGPMLAGGQTRDFAIPSSVCGIPSNAAAYSLNVTVVPAGSLGYLTMWPAGQLRPLVSTLNSFDGTVVANAALTPAGAGGAISVFVTDATHVILDINGYFLPESLGQGLTFYTAAPCRVADSRLAAGTFGGPQLAGGQTRDYPVPQSACGIPASAQAYSLNATVVPQEPLGYLTLWPSGSARPLVSTLNSFQGLVVANAAIVPAGAGSRVSAFVTNRTDLILDVNGYFAAPGSANALRFFPVTPCRVADTRQAAGTFGGPQLAAGQTRDYPVPQSACGIPNGAQAYSLNVTVVPQEPLGYLTLWPSGPPQPLVSTLNSFQGKVVANAALVPAGAGGAIRVYVTNRTDVILDINGYFAP